MGTDVLFTRFFRAARLALLATATALAIAATGASAQQTAPAQAQVTLPPGSPLLPPQQPGEFFG